MTVSLWFQSNEQFPGGFYSTFAGVEDATAQAVADIAAHRVPAPDRIVDDETGAVLADRASLAKE